MDDVEPGGADGDVQAAPDPCAHLYALRALLLAAKESAADAFLDAGVAYNANEAAIIQCEMRIGVG